MTTREINRSELAIWEEGTRYTTDDLVRMYEAYCREEEEADREPLNENRWAMREIRENKRPVVRVVVWAGTQQQSFEVATYEEAMQTVDEYHRNLHGPAFYNLETGEELVDDGHGLASEAGVYTC